MQENSSYLTEQIITYLGNKRALLDFLNEGFFYAKNELGRDKFSFCDLFSGSGIVSRFAKAHSNFIVANDLEEYSSVINRCYLSNQTKELLENIELCFEKLRAKDEIKEGFISKLYAPKNDSDIKKDERVFYTRQNALAIDTIRQNIEKFIPNDLKVYFIAPLLYLASVHTNTSGVFKGFYKNKDGVGEFGGRGKNALSRIMKPIELQKPIFSNFSLPFEVLKKDAISLSKQIDTDVCYLDPPYNQHPYGSNYFMLNIIANYKEPKEISKVSGITKDWNRSLFNKEAKAKDSLLEIVSNLRSKIILISYNCEGFIKKEEFLKELVKFGEVKFIEKRYNTFRGSRNLNSQPLHIKEQLYIVKKS
ncbi:DNA adenine methylase [uncultured Campylobacter sp.]|uniref:DNA adenine methylase n=1 Tax=uncultured Campylobacter sp. TaxID=218934 RepID=UPI002636EDCB|nr:DNA adenine methylase [uncultured Campylobacter sp.]